MKENPYDNPEFFEKYSQMDRSKKGLSGAGEWAALKELLPDFSGKRVLDLGCGYGWHCAYAAEHGAVSVVADGKNVLCGIQATREEMDYTLDKLCKGSLYAYADEIRCGVITTDSGLRAGVCGTAVTEKGNLVSVRDISSVSLRIPHRIEGAADFMLPLIERYDCILVYSRPAGGKTTVLRELIPTVSERHRTSVIDTRYELSCFLDKCQICDVFLGYPRYDGIMSSVRTMSPEYIICDEISTEEEAEAVVYAHAAGVKVIASAHAGSLDELKKNKAADILLKKSVFDCLCGLNAFGEAPTITIPEVTEQ